MEKILREIDAIVGRINTHPEYSECVNSRTSRDLVEAAGRHSLDLELKGEGDPRYLGRDHSKSLRDLTMAENFLTREGVSVYALSVLGNMIEPENQPYKGFRRVDVNFPSPHERILGEIDSLVSFLSSTDSHPVKRAINAHIDILRIHPYEDGNSRSARLLQNFCLRERGYPPAIITPGERDLYRALRKTVLFDRYSHQSSFEKPSKSEEIFNEFIASKVLESVKVLEGELRSKRMYEIYFYQLKKPAVMEIVAHHLRSYGRKKEHQGVKVSIDKKEGRGKNLIVVGDISKKEIELVLQKSNERNNFKYEINTNPFICY